MSTIPPPPPPFGSNQGSFPDASAYDPRTFDRRTLKAQRRAFAKQARLQRNAFRAETRMQMRANRRNSVGGPLLLLSLGVMLLLLQTGHLQWQTTLLWFGHWWPAILIFEGLVMAAEWAFDLRQAREGRLPPGSRRSLGSGAVALLILLALVGASIMGAQNSSAWFQQTLDNSLRQNGFSNWRQHLGLRSDFTEELHAPLADDGRLTIEDPRGDVTVTGSSVDGQVHVSVHQHIFAWQANDVAERRRAERVQFSGGRTQLTLAAPATEQDDADLIIEVPHDAALIVHSAHGDVTLEELRGSVAVNARNGNVKLTALRGPVRLQTEDDNASITAHSLAGGLTLDGRTGDIDLSDIEGPVALHGDFFGTTHIERVRGSVHFQSSFTDFACAGVPGNFNVEGRSDLEADRLLGPVTVATTNRNLALHSVGGGATISDRNGSVTLSLSGPPQPVRVSNENGSVELSLPANQGFSVQARTQNGQIENDFALAPHKSGELSELTSLIGHGGPTLTLQTTEGDIHLRKATNDADTDQDDTPERITPTPATPNNTGSHPRHAAL